MVHWVVDTAFAVGADPIVLVVGRGRELVEKSLKNTGVRFVIQHTPLGTAHAVEQTRPILAQLDTKVLVLSGDVPGVTRQAINALCRRHDQTGAKATMLTAELPNPTGYGRVIKNEEGHLLRVVEEKDATEEERSIREINGGIYLFDAEALFQTLPLVQNHNKQNEYYLPDVLYILREQNQIVAIEKADNPKDILGINTQEELRIVHAEVFN
jgi:bifunctional UDP-N-acetylglucosamine pyrophosphorylase/glucosamine-1-phosphate N-acetyltransferase